MKKLLAIAALLLASTAAQAQYSFDYGGRTIRIDPDRGTVQIPGVYDNTRKNAKRPRDDQDGDRPRKPQQAKGDPQPPAAEPTPAQPAPAPAAACRSAARHGECRASGHPGLATAFRRRTAAASPAGSGPDAGPAARPAPAPAPVVATAPAAPAPTVAIRPAAANSPIGLWLTEEREGKVRIEQCGPNLCGYSVDARSNQNGEQILINMKPTRDAKWSGRIHDPSSGSTYDSTIAMKGSDSLRVQGCAFGGMFCGGQTWSRLN